MLKRLFGRRAAPAPRVEPAPPAPRADALPAGAAAGGRRGWAASRPDRIAGFTMFAPSPQLEARRELRGLVSHARHAAQNFDHARGYEMLARRHVIGPDGIRLEMDVREAPTAARPEGLPDRLANRIIGEAWRDWGALGVPTPCGRLSWWHVECLVATALVREGGAFVRLRRRGPWGLQVEPVPFDLVDIDLSQPLRGGAWIDQGVEFDAEGRVAAFHLWTAEPQDGVRPVPRRRMRVPAAQMLHVALPEGVGDVMGVPRSATALRLMNLEDKFREAGMAAAQYGAANMLFFEQEDAGTVGAAHDDVPIDRMEAGTIAMLPPGVKPAGNQVRYPEAAVEPFLRTMAQAQAAGLGVSYETLTSDLSRANFSSLRAGKGEERDEWRMLQRAIYEGLHARVFAAWVPSAIAAGRINLPSSKTAKWLRGARWRPRGWPSVNPKDDASAAQVEIGLGLRSRTELAAARGRRFEDVLAELAAERAAMEAAGLSPAQVDAALAAPAADAPQDADQEGGGNER